MGYGGTKGGKSIEEKHMCLEPRTNSEIVANCPFTQYLNGSDMEYCMQKRKPCVRGTIALTLVILELQ